MKRAIGLFLAVILILSLAACGVPVVQEEAIPVPAVTATPKPVETPEPVPAVSPEEQAQLAVCEEIINKADIRRDGILNSPTEVTVTGTSYYVSAEGNDENDGLSPETPWRTVQKVNDSQLQPGDGVFFRRGDVWREVLANDYADVTYSAYGEGAKPEFYDSPENGGGAEKWTLLEGTDNIWIYQTPMPMLGSITFNRGEAVASQHLSYWNGKEYTEYGTDDVPVDITGMKNMRFFIDIDLSECQKESWRNGQNGDLYVYSLFDTGTLYLRCDEGNPGALYSNIEFAGSRCMCTGGGCIIDNLCMLYMGNGVMPSPETLQGVTVQNCEIAFVGDAYISFEKETKHGVDGGECFSTQGYENVITNTYCHHARDGVLTVELGWDGEIRAANQHMGGLDCSGNLFEYCNVGIGITSFIDHDIDIEIDNIDIRDNYFLYTGYPEDYSNEGVDEIAGAVINLYFPDGLWSDLKNSTVRDNVFFLSRSKMMNLLNLGRAELEFSGNTYVQGMYQRAFVHGYSSQDQREYYAADEAAFAAAVHDVLGDTNATVHTISLGLENAEIEKAYRLGLVPDGAPADLNTQMTSAELTQVLTKYVEYTDQSKLGEWEALSATAAKSDAKLLRCDGMLSLYELAMALGRNLPTPDLGWTNFLRTESVHGDPWAFEIGDLNYSLYPNVENNNICPGNPNMSIATLSLVYALGQYSHATSAYVLDYDQTNETIHGSDPLTWEMALKAVVRMVNMADADTDKEFLVYLQ